MTDMESPRKNNDCYFYYYSTCSKGDSCGFRHEPSALGCETVCSFWKEGKCLNVHCNFRHMELKKNRKAMPCYWESQPGGCLKPHCPFMHHASGSSAPSENAAVLNNSEAVIPENCTQTNNYRTKVDSLVVSFEEESDSDSVPSASPVKMPVPKAKTEEELKIEQVLAASRAYYDYPGAHMIAKNLYRKVNSTYRPHKDFRYQIYRRVTVEKAAVPSKLSKDQMASILGDNSLASSDGNKMRLIRKHKTPDIKIQTLKELQAERKKL